MTMKWIKMFGMLGLIAACFCVAHTAPLPSSQSSSSQSGLSITLSPPADPITLAAPIEIVITVKNTSNKEILWEADHYWDVERYNPAYTGFHVLLTKDGHEPETTFLHRASRGTPGPGDPHILLNGSAFFSPIEPGKSFTLKMDLQRLYRIMEPGEYILEVSRYEPGSKTWVRSNKLTLKISGQASSSQPRFSITLSPPADPITLAAPIEIVITVKNTSNQELEWTADIGDNIAYMDDEKNYRAFHVLLTKDGHEPVTTVFHRMLRGIPGPDDPAVGFYKRFLIAAFEPRQSSRLTIDLKRLYQITEPGEYTLEVSHYEEESKTTIHSNKLTLKIAQ